MDGSLNKLLKNLILGLIIVGVLAVLVFRLQALFFEKQNNTPVDTEQTSEEVTPSDEKEEVADIPPFTDKIKKQLEESPGFSALVSYTDRGFEPAKLTVSRGDTVRFTNNSGRDLYVSENGSQSCEDSVMNSCEVIKPLEFWEYTFTTSGVIEYSNREFSSDNGVITVEAI